MRVCPSSDVGAVFAGGRVPEGRCKCERGDGGALVRVGTDAYADSAPRGDVPVVEVGYLVHAHGVETDLFCSSGGI